MTQKDIYVMETIVDKLTNGCKLSAALKLMYSKRHVCIPYNETYANIQLIGLNMSMRTTNALLRGGLKTIGDVIEFYTWYDKKGNVIHEPSDDEE